MHVVAGWRCVQFAGTGDGTGVAGRGARRYPQVADMPEEEVLAQTAGPEGSGGGRRSLRITDRWSAVGA